MKNKIVILISILLVFCAFVFTSCGKSDESPWIKNWDAASEKAELNGKNILIFFSMLEGAEDNPYVIQSQNFNNAFNKRNFQKKLAKEYILLNVDFNNNKEQLDYDEMMSAYELANRFAVQTLPSIVLATPEGYVITFISEQEMENSADKVLKKLASFNKKSAKITKLREELNSAEGVERLPIIDELITNLDKDYRYVLVDLLAEIKMTDPDNETGLYEKYILDFAYIEALDAFGKGDAQKAIDIFLETADSGRLSPSDAQEAYQTVAYLLANTGLGSSELVLEYLQKAVDANPESEETAALEETINYIKSTMESETKDDVSKKEN